MSWLSIISLLILSSLPTLAYSQTAAFQPVIDNHYAGGYKDQFADELQRIPALMTSAQQDIPIQLGYGQAFNYPVTIHFSDGGPAYAENPFFSIEPQGAGAAFSQNLIVNVEAFARRKTDIALHNAFYYAMTQLILNDATAGEQNQPLPVWIQEGISIYLSGRGDALVRRTDALVDDLNLTYPYLTDKQWASYYLAIQYISNATPDNLKNFLQALVDGQSPSDAILKLMNITWPVFVQSELDYAHSTFNRFHKTAQPEEPAPKKHSLFDDPSPFDIPSVPS